MKLELGIPPSGLTNVLIEELVSEEAAVMY